MYNPGLPDAGVSRSAPEGVPAPFGFVPGAPAAPPLPLFPGATRPREPFRRRPLAAVGAAWQWAEVAMDRLVSPPLNPLYHTGTIAMF